MLLLIFPTSLKISVSANLEFSSVKDTRKKTEGRRSGEGDWGKTKYDKYELSFPRTFLLYVGIF